jgi:hypothetical protein
MTGGDDSFLARWSRRKQAAEGAERSEAADEKTADGGPVPLPRSAEDEPAADASEPEPPPLPRVEDLTADSDVSAFLRAGVPEGLRTAALRRAWSLDPAIRDFVGPSEYAHDFNNPATIPGFGAGPGWDVDTAAAYAQKIVNRSAAESFEQTVSRAGDPSGEPELNPVRLDPAAGRLPAPAVTMPPPSPETPAAAATHDEAPQGEERHADRPAGGPPPRHGGAMPR